MSTTPWFKRKKYGWGWIPAAWQGWAVLFLYVVVNITLFRAVDLHSHSGSDTLINFAPRFLFLTAGLSALCWFTDGKSQ